MPARIKKIQTKDVTDIEVSLGRLEIGHRVSLLFGGGEDLMYIAITPFGSLRGRSS